MANTAANAIDWYLDKLNRIGILPINGAMVLRDISAKQIGGKDFKPRQVGIDNFTKDQLAAIYRLSGEGKKHILDESYASIPGYKMKTIHDLWGRSHETYDSTDLNLGSYFSPARAISTSLGRATVGKDKDSGDYILNDTYDFDQWLSRKLKEKSIGGDYKYYADADTGRYFSAKDALDKVLNEQVEQKSTTYGKLRGAAQRLGHTGKDPDSSKIHVKLNMSDVKKRIGDDWREVDLNKPMTRGGWAWRGAGAGAMTMAPVGAVLGALAGAMRLVDKKKRKEWIKTMLLHTLGGAGVAAIAGALGGSYAFDKVWKKFEKKSSADDRKDKTGKKKRPGKSSKGSVLDSIGAGSAYSIPPLALLALLGYGLHKYDNLTGNTLDRPFRRDDLVDIEPEAEAENA